MYAPPPLSSICTGAVTGGRSSWTIFGTFARLAQGFDDRGRDVGCRTVRERVVEERNLRGVGVFWCRTRPSATVRTNVAPVRQRPRRPVPSGFLRPSSHADVLPQLAYRRSRHDQHAEHAEQEQQRHGDDCGQATFETGRRRPLRAGRLRASGRARSRASPPRGRAGRARRVSGSASRRGCGHGSRVRAPGAACAPRRTTSTIGIGTGRVAHHDPQQRSTALAHQEQAPCAQVATAVMSPNARTASASAVAAMLGVEFTCRRCPAPDGPGQAADDGGDRAPDRGNTASEPFEGDNRAGTTRPGSIGVVRRLETPRRVEPAPLRRAGARERVAEAFTTGQP